ncbi:MAG: TetR/AcrR family transcriptional regulator [Wenzhouxiangellaceae bacterium]
MGRVSDARERLLKAVTELMWENSYGSASVDAICRRAGVKKGSFYYFFESKSDLAVAALEDQWQHTEPELEKIFAASTPPLQRLRNYFEAVYTKQRECCEQRAYALGCPYQSIGAEICTQDAKILNRVRMILDRTLSYIEKAVRDAYDNRAIAISDPQATAWALFCLYEGALAQARIHNNPHLLRDLPAAAMQQLGVAQDQAADDQTSPPQQALRQATS